MEIPLILKRDNKGYILIRENGEYAQHSHISTIVGVHKVIECIKKERIPDSTYLRESCRRLLTEEEFARLRPKKDKYYNSKNRRNM